MKFRDYLEEVNWDNITTLAGGVAIGLATWITLTLAFNGIVGLAKVLKYKKMDKSTLY